MLALKRPHREKILTTVIPIVRPSHLQIYVPGGPKITRAALSKRVIDGSCAIDHRFYVVHIFYLYNGIALYMHDMVITSKSVSIKYRL